MEEALADPALAGMTTEALRALINAILVFPGERRGKVSVTLRGIERRFLRSDAVVLQLAPANKKAALLGENGVGWEGLGTLGCGDAQPTMSIRRRDHLEDPQLSPIAHPTPVS